MTRKSLIWHMENVKNEIVEGSPKREAVIYRLIFSALIELLKRK